MTPKPEAKEGKPEGQAVPSQGHAGPSSSVSQSSSDTDAGGGRREFDRHTEFKDLGLQQRARQPEARVPSEKDTEIPTASELVASDVDDKVPQADKDPSRATLLERVSDPKQHEKIGRYDVIAVLGRGGMGTVLAAYDSFLDRNVALKLLHPELSRKPEQEQRLLREAQAMARLSHPNVVQVYEADLVEGQLFIAMEQVKGETLSIWQRASARSWRACLKTYIQAGRGLEAAHLERLVHRDFKPVNCIMDEQGRVRVLDFGLARDTTMIPAQVDATANSHSNVLSENITRAGALVGTVAYMSPEQLQGKPADARSDQFSFCVSLYEALYGQRPFNADTGGALLASILSGRYTKPLSGKRRYVPAWLRRILKRGLAPEPEQRYPDMTALLTALEVIPRRRALAWGGLAFLGLTAGVGVAVWEAVDDAPRPCTELRSHPGWDKNQRKAVEASILSSELSDAKIIWEVVSDGVDAYAKAWSMARLDACEATYIRHTSTEAVYHQEIECLDRRMQVVDSLAERLIEGEREIIARAALVALDLPSIEDCRNDEVLSPQGPPPVPLDLADEVKQIRDDAAEIFVLERLGRFDEGLKLAQTNVEAARGIAEQYELTLGEALLGYGRLQRRSRRFKEASEALLEAEGIAESNRHDSLAHDVLQELVILSHGQEAASEGKIWLHQARAKLDRIDGSELQRLRLLHHEGKLAHASKEYDEGGRLLEQAVEGYRQRLPTTKLQLSHALLSLADLRDEQGRSEEALHFYEEALAGYQDLGALHGAGEALYNIGSLHILHGNYDGASSAYGRALKVLKEFHDENAPVLAFTHYGLANSLMKRGLFDEAIVYAREAKRIHENGGDSVNDDLVWSLMLIGYIEVGRYNLKQAVESFRHAERLLKALDNPDPAALASIYSSIGNSLRGLGRLSEAEESCMQAVVLLKETIGNDNPMYVHALLELGRVKSDQGRFAAAQEHLQAAWDLQVQYNEDDPLRGADVAASLAKTLWKLGETARVRQLVSLARETYMRLNRQREAGEIDAWLDECGQRCR